MNKPGFEYRGTANFERRPGGQQMKVARGVAARKDRQAAALSLSPGAVTIVRKRTAAVTSQTVDPVMVAMQAKLAKARAKVKPRGMPLGLAQPRAGVLRLKGQAHGR